MKQFTVKTYSYDKELGRDVITASEDFSSREKAEEYFNSCKPDKDSVVVFRGDWGYTPIDRKEAELPVDTSDYGAFIQP